MQPRRNARVERSSGGVVVAVREGEPWVTMIATRERTRWGLPKGAAQQGETSAQAAVREVREETGLEAEVVEPLETIEYFFKAGGVLIHKYVDFFLMAHRGGSLQPQLEEVDDCAWFRLSDALERSSYPSEKKILERLAAAWDTMDGDARARFG